MSVERLQPIGSEERVSRSRIYTLLDCAGISTRGDRGRLWNLITRSNPDVFAVATGRILSDSRLGQDFFSFLPEIVRDQNLRISLVAEIFADKVDARESLTRAIIGFREQTKEHPARAQKMIQQLQLYIGEARRVSHDSYLSRGQRVGLGAVILANPVIFKLFGEDVKRVVRFANRFFFKHNSDVSFEGFLNACLVMGSHSHVKELLKGFDESVFYKLGNLGANFTFDFDNILISEEKSVEANKLLRQNKDWVERITVAPTVFKNRGFPLVKSEAFENFLISSRYSSLRNFDVRKLKPEERYNTLAALVRPMSGDAVLALKSELASENGPYIDARLGERLKRIGRREDPRHPLVSLGIAQTVGFEIEYPKTSLSNRLRQVGVLGMLDLLGFKMGRGGNVDGPADEISPGPFYDPLTANVVFEIFRDAGVIDLYNYKDLTLHFNVGILNQRSLTSLVRGLYLTGACYDALLRARGGFLKVNGNSSAYGSYSEAKAFEVLTPHEFTFNMRWASYLSWALAAWNRSYEGPQHMWQRELQGIWNNYLVMLTNGLIAAGFSNYLSTGYNSDPVVLDVDQQLKLILPTVASRYQDIFSKDSKFDPRIRGVRLGFEKWPNLVAFARDITEDAVSKVEDIADEVEAEVVRDIREIEDSEGLSRRMLIGSFVEKYNVKVKLGKHEEINMEKAYEAVRLIFSDFGA